MNGEPVFLDVGKTEAATAAAGSAAELLDPKLMDPKLMDPKLMDLELTDLELTDLELTDAKVMDRAAIEARVIAIVARSLDRPESEVHLRSRFWVDLDAESLDMLDIIYGLERGFRIRMPRLNLLNRASDVFGEDMIVREGLITETGVAVMRLSMPEVPAEWLQPGMRMYDFRKVILVESFVRLVERCLVAVEALRCGVCGGRAVPDEASEMTRRCELCRAPVDLPSGEQLLQEDLKRCAHELGWSAPEGAGQHA